MSVSVGEFPGKSVGRDTAQETIFSRVFVPGVIRIRWDIPQKIRSSKTALAEVNERLW